MPHSNLFQAPARRAARAAALRTAVARTRQHMNPSPWRARAPGLLAVSMCFFLFFHEALVDASTFLLGSVLVTSPYIWTATSGVIVTMLMGWQLWRAGSSS
jgi:hypothetical protein